MNNQWTDTEFKILRCTLNGHCENQFSTKPVFVIKMKHDHLFLRGTVICPLPM